MFLLWTFGAEQSTIGLASKAFRLGWIFHHAALCRGTANAPRLKVVTSA